MSAPRTLTDIVTTAATVTPEGIAVLDPKSTLSFAELDSVSNQFAHLLWDAGVRHGDLVGLYVEKSPLAVAALYGILKAGGAYVPIDPGAPALRVAAILRNSRPRAVVSESQLWSPFESEEFEAIPCIAIDSNTGDQRRYGLADLNSAPEVRPNRGQDLQADDSAYVLYTSGSSGAPKGVVHRHASAVAFATWAAATLGLHVGDRLASQAPLHFDLSTLDVFGAAVASASTVIVPNEIAIFPLGLRTYVETMGITVWYSVPSTFISVMNDAGLIKGSLPALRTLVFAGEVFPAHQVRRLMELLPDVSFYNFYGPTETNVCTYWPLPRPLDRELTDIPIGTPVNGDHVYVVAEDCTLAPRGETGELYVSGATLMAGYLGDPEATATTLVEHLPGAAERGPFYKTGDLGFEDRNGLLRFVGRRDDQIKSRGYRIELGEIESVLGLHPNVLEVAVIAVGEVGDTALYAFVAAHDRVAPTELRKHLNDRLPSYMIPDQIDIFPTLPRTAGGKVDRKALKTAARERRGI